MSLLTAIDLLWLRENYPNLIPNDDLTELTGEIEFAATYNPESDQFLILSQGVENSIGGIEIREAYTVTIRQRKPDEYITSKFPAVIIEKNQVNRIPDRHFNLDMSACICGPVEEAMYLKNRFDFPRFLQRLIIPFLYGQAYYEQFDRWPWPEYAHGATGILESYFLGEEPAFASICLRRLEQDSNWPRIKALLLQKSIKGHTPCTCGSTDFTRRCHPDAWQGLQQLQKDLREQKIKI